VVEAVLAVARSDANRSIGAAARDRERWSAWRSLLRPLPVAAALAAVVAAALWLVPDRVEEVPLDADLAEAVITEEATVPTAEVERAAAEARWALAFVSTVSRRTGEQIRDEVIAKRWIGATARSLGAVSPQDTAGGQRPQEVSGRHET
ncbi:MAG: hypothetical protein R3244_03275, partial [Thermoanaerobaculia bacterium]|nr:hypothetical protein [Thermoanaerobaculia bacterium]